MTDDEYLHHVLKDQTLATDGQEMKDIVARGAEVQKILEDHFSDCTPTIKDGGSKAKGTMIRDSYDLDKICYFPRDDDDAGGTLKEIYENTEKALTPHYIVQRKPSALRLLMKQEVSRGLPTHIDVVPGRYVDGDSGDVYLFQSSGEKQHLKTNLEKHIKHVVDSGVRDAVRLGKLWNVRHGVNAKTFILELLIIGLLKEKKDAALTDQLTHVWKVFRDNADDLYVEDPANSGNDLTPILDLARPNLSMIARSTLTLIENSGWEAVFGKIVTETGDEKKAKLWAAVSVVEKPTKPWFPG